MGSIASVLQWHCSECALINPTESARCARCGLTRFRSDERASLGRLDRTSSVSFAAAERSAHQERSGKQVAGGGNERRSTRRHEDEDCPRGESSSGESTPPTPPPRTDKLLARNSTETSLSVDRRVESRRPVASW